MNHTRVLSASYPLSALCDALHCDVNSLKTRCGIDHRQAARYSAEGLTEARADQLAVRAGLNPLEVWPSFGQVPCHECGGMFAPRRKGHRFCTKVCSRRLWQRQRYRTDPAFAAMKIASARGYYRDNGDYVRARENRRYHARTAA